LVNNTRIEQLKLEFAERWEAAIERQQGEMSRPSERHFGALRHWPTYEVIRAQTWKVISSLDDNGSTIQQFLEREFVGFEGRVRGRPDRVTVGPKEASVEDFKTGSIYETAEGDTQVLKPSFRRQMLTYSALVHEELDRWPDRASLVALSGEVETFPIDPGEATAAVADSIDLLNAYNSRVDTASTPEDVATPSDLGCRFCPHADSCEPFWTAATERWTGSLAVEGTIVRKETAQNGRIALQVDVQRGTILPGSVLIARLDPVRFPDAEMARPGLRLRATKLRAKQRALESGWFSTLRVIQ
jgi:hypothetical protein